MIDLHPDQDQAPRTAVTTRLLNPWRPGRALGPDALAHAVHGLVLFLALVGATFVADYPAWKMLLYPVAALALFYGATVYAAVLASQHTADASLPTALATTRHEAGRALPLLEAVTAPLVPLLLAWAGVLPLPLGYAASVTTGVATLALIGFLALRHRGATLRRQLLAGVATGGFGAAIIAAETFLH